MTKKFESGQHLFWQNKDCVYQQDIGDYRALVEVCVDYTPYDDGGYSEPVFAEVIVNKSELMHSKVDLEQQLKDNLALIEYNVKMAIDIKRNGLMKEIEVAEKSKVAALKNAKKYDVLNDAIGFMEGKIKWAVLISELVIMDMGKVSKDSYWGTRTPALVLSLNGEDCSVKLMVSEDNSGSADRKVAQVFESEDLAKAFLAKIVDDKLASKPLEESYYVTRAIKNYGLSSVRMDEYMAEVDAKAKDRAVKEVDDLKKKLKEAEARIK